jgi:hypothetical protein
VSLKDEILARQDCAAAVAARDITQIAQIVSNGRTATQSRYVTARTILAECSGGGAILDKLNTASNNSALPYASTVAWAMNFLKQDSGLDVGNQVTQGLIDQLVLDGQLDAAQGSALKQLAVLPAPVSQSDVAEALYNPDGTQK